MTQVPGQYVVCNTADAMRQLAFGLLGSGVFVGLVGLTRGNWGFAGLAVAIALVFFGLSAFRAWKGVVVGPAGIGMTTRRGSSRQDSRRAQSPWHSIHRVELFPAEENIRVWLRADAPLPEWVTGRIIDPTQPEVGGSWERVVPGLDPVAFELAVRAHAPHVEVHTVR